MVTPAPTRSDCANGDPVRGSSNQHSPRSADELTERNVRTIIALERQAKSSHSMGERVAARIAASFGSATFVLLHFALFAAWIFFNTSSAFAQHPDPFPFPRLTLFVALEAIILSGVILISQNLETRRTEQRSHLDLQINLLIEQENTRMLKLLRSIAVKVGADIETDPGHLALEESTRPERLLDQIEKATAATRGES